MNIVQAETEADWAKASEMLTRVVDHLNRLGQPLWTKEQVSVAGLQRSYQLDELYFLRESECVGVVFLQDADVFFWPEIIERDCLYIHKLAIDPPFVSLGLGPLAIDVIIQEACKKHLNWVRLDCDDRPALHRFYQSCGFNLVDAKEIGIFRVARYQLLTKTGERFQRTSKSCFLEND